MNTRARDMARSETAWKSGPFVQRVGGRMVQQAALDAVTTEARSSELEPAQAYACEPHKHAKLQGNRRCLGCGRTRNEIELEEG